MTTSLLIALLQEIKELAGICSNVRLNLQDVKISCVDGKLVQKVFFV
jgi:hypothetical protein